MSSTDDIAASLLRIYDVFRDIGYISQEDIVPAPHDEGAINIELWRSIGMNDAVIDFLKKIPWARAGSGDFIKDSEIIDFSNGYSVRQSRNLSSVPANGAGASWFDGSLVSLTIRGQKGRAFVVDASRGTIRIWDGVGDLLAMEERNACAVLDEIYHRYFHLEEIPFEFSILAPTAELMGGVAGASAIDNNNRYGTVKLLAQQCGWPEYFSVEAFKAAASALPSPKKTDSGSSSGSTDGNNVNGVLGHEGVENQVNGVLDHEGNENQADGDRGHIPDHGEDEGQANSSLGRESEHGSHRAGSSLSSDDSSG